MTVRSMLRSVPAASGAQPIEIGRKAPAARIVAIPETALAVAREIYQSRRKRERFLAADLFGEPTWDILLDLFIAAGEGRRVPTTSACIGANVPPTTALRWLRILETRGLVEREDDGRDGRRTFVCLTECGVRATISLMGHVQGGFSAIVDRLGADGGQLGAFPAGEAL